MFRHRIPRFAALVLCAAAALALIHSKKSLSSSSSPDPLAAEIARERAVLEALPDADGMLKQVKEAALPVVARADEALAAGRRVLALQRLGAAYVNVAAAEYLAGFAPAARADVKAFEAEWAKRGSEIAAPPRAESAGALRPAAVRAVAEATLPQAKILYDASYEYGRSTMADAGLYYIGLARAQSRFLSFCRSLGEPSAGSLPPLRALGPDLDAFERDLLAAYKPPASIERHPDFIAASASLKEARELDAAGLRYGALLRYLQGALRFAAPPPAEAAVLAERLMEFRARLAGSVDHTIARIFLESAESDLAASAAKPGTPPSVANAIVSEVLPRYFAALGAPPREAPRPDAIATITLVRWPYT